MQVRINYQLQTACIILSVLDQFTLSRKRGSEKWIYHIQQYTLPYNYLRLARTKFYRICGLFLYKEQKIIELEREKDKGSKREAECTSLFVLPKLITSRQHNLDAICSLILSNDGPITYTCQLQSCFIDLLIRILQIKLEDI